ncbi:MAG: hypothetical protein Q9169_007796 [Polycauliona sp. 2 TL-2023]
MDHMDLPDSSLCNLALIEVSVYAHVYHLRATAGIRIKDSAKKGPATPESDATAREGYSEDDTPPSSTHPSNFDHDHISNLKVFSEDLQSAIANSFPRPRTAYTSVHVLLLRWDEDDLNVQVELTMLKLVFESQFRFLCEQFDIPGRDPTRALQKKLYEFQDAHQGEDELLIVYYGGHGDPDRRGRSIWAANKKPDSPTLNWSSLQHLLETAIPHVLIILDCCYAANAARDTADGTTKELLAACGRENPTLGTGVRSFTTSLIEELQAFGNRPFTAAMLHSRLITMRWRLAFTPIYALLSEHGGHSIELAPQPPPVESADLDMSDDLMDISSPESCIAADTRVLLAITITDDAVCDVAEWKKWLTSRAPWDVTKIEVEVEAVFKSHSTMLITSLPTVAWDKLPNKAAYRFIGFVRSANLIHTQVVMEQDNEPMSETIMSLRREVPSLQSTPLTDSTAAAAEELREERYFTRNSLLETQRYIKIVERRIKQKKLSLEQWRARLEQQWNREKEIQRRLSLLEDCLPAWTNRELETKTFEILPSEDGEAIQSHSRPSDVAKSPPIKQEGLRPNSRNPRNSQARTLDSLGASTPDFQTARPRVKNPEDSDQMIKSGGSGSAPEFSPQSGSLTLAEAAMISLPSSPTRIGGQTLPHPKDRSQVKMEETNLPLPNASPSPVDLKIEMDTARTSHTFKPGQRIDDDTSKSATLGDIDHAPSSYWTDEMDLLLQKLWQQGYNWSTIAQCYFPSKTAYACRERLERLKEKEINDSGNFELLATLYVQLRGIMWRK